MNIVSRELKEGKLEIVCRESSNMIYPTNPPQLYPDSVWKEVYIATDKGIVLEKKIAGKHTPICHIPEKISFPEGD